MIYINGTKATPAQENNEQLEKFVEAVNRHKTRYINGIKASNDDLWRLFEDLVHRKNSATAHTTKSGNLAIVTEF
jgi:hypothetical protein